MDNRKPIFDALRVAKGGSLSANDVVVMDDALTKIGVPLGTTQKVSSKGIALLHQFEGCRLTAYPDPGSKDGHPWTIGWGATGEGIKKGVVWTQAQADQRFERDLVKYAEAVSRFIGNAPTTQNQFDALVSFQYNTGAISKSTLGSKHKSGDYAGAKAEFARWNKNDGKVMAGLTRRRAAEAKLYGSKS